jgi:hypothetical protein
VFPKEAAGRVDYGLPVLLSLNSAHTHYRPPFFSLRSKSK